MYVGFFHENRRCMNKIVYVEDEPEVGQLIAAYLGKHDMDVIVEPRGDRAEEVVVRENPDLVLLDIMLPRPARPVGGPYRPAHLAGQRYEPHPVAGDGCQ